jgi:hypothetical protein
MSWKGPHIRGGASRLLTKGEDMTTYHVGYLVGSLAKASINRLLAKALTRLAPRPS